MTDVALVFVTPFTRGDLVELRPEFGLDVRGEVWATEVRDGVLHVHLRGGKWWRAEDLRRVESKP